MRMKNQYFVGNGTSLWGNSKGKFNVIQVEVEYVNWVSYPRDLTSPLHASVNLFGPNTDWSQYTDTAIEKQIRNCKPLLKIIRQEIQAKLDAAGITRTVPSQVTIGWSEQGLQPENGWNFDVGTKFPLTFSRE